MLNESSIAFKDGSGFLAETAVFHELHCIVRGNLFQRYQTETDSGFRNAFDVICTLITTIPI